MNALLKPKKEDALAEIIMYAVLLYDFSFEPNEHMSAASRVHPSLNT